jgi:HEAT repeat protein
MQTTWAQDADFEEEVRTLFRDGIEAYEQGKYDLALEKLERALELDPDKSLLFALVEEVSYDKLFEMIRLGRLDEKQHKLKNTALRIIELSKPAAEAVRSDEATINGYVEDLKSDEYDTVQIAMYHLMHMVPYSIPPLIPVLANEREDHWRNNVILTLVKMRDHSVNAVIEALNSTSKVQRQNAALVLEMIRDERAIPALKAVWENPDEIPEVKLKAATALLKITNQEAAELKSAKEYYYLLAEKYYYAHPSVMLTYFLDFYIWEWNDDTNGLDFHEVPAFAYNEIMAEEACMDGLELDQHYEPIWPLLAQTQYALVAEASDAIRNTNLQVQAQYADMDDLIKIQKQLGSYTVADAVARLVGREMTYRALTRSIEDDTPLVSQSILDALKDMGEAGELPPYYDPNSLNEQNNNQNNEAAAGPAFDRRAYFGYPLVDALTNQDKRVRYWASDVMVRINPQERKVGMELVVPNLVDALSEQGIRVVLVIVEPKQLKDKEFMHIFKNKLGSLNVLPVVAENGREGILKAKSFPNADLIIIEHSIANEVYFQVDLTDKKEPIVESVFDTIDKDVRLTNVPTWILTEGPDEMSQAKSIYLDKAQQYVDRGIDKLELRDLLRDAFRSPEAQKDSKDRADEISKMAAESLEAIDPTNTLYPYMDAVPAMVKTLALEQPREDFIRIPVINALGNYGAVEAIDVLAGTLDDQASNAKEVRLACANALANIYKQNRIAPSDEIYRILKNNLYQGDPSVRKSGDLDIELAVGEALGSAHLTPEQRFELAAWKRQHDVPNWDQ